MDTGAAEALPVDGSSVMSSVDGAKDPKRGRGRPPKLDRDRALDAAMRLFWERGYEGATYQSLLDGMDLSASSFQKAFGTKEGLYRAAVERYLTGPTSWFMEALQAEATTKVAFERLIEEGAKAFTGDDFPVGCMISIAAAQVAPEHRAIKDFATDIRLMSQAALEARIRKGIRDGDVPSGTDAKALGAFFATLFRGMAVQARDGADADTLRSIGATAMTAWPR